MWNALWRQRSAWLLALLFTLLTLSPVRAAEFMPVADIREGMTGIAKTVVHGDEISEFQVQVLGVLKQRGPSGDLILVKVSGPVIDKTGGIAQGMSGSPVYIDGKLVGAIGYGWGFADGRIGMVTPIEDMLKLWTIKDAPKLSFIKDLPQGLVPVETPLMATGYSTEALDYLTRKLAPYHLVPYATGGAGSYDDHMHSLQPGSAVAATLVTGDLKLGAIGTVTYADENKIVAFGHPFLKRGAIQYYMHNSYIFTVVPSVNSAFKIGSIGAEIGRIEQDRGAGIAGTEHLAPKAIPMTVTVRDMDTKAERRADVRLVDDTDLTSVLASTTVYDLVKKTIDRGGRGTVTFDYTLQPRDPKQKAFHRRNMYYSSRSVSEKAVDELYNVLDIFAKNKFADYDLRNIQMNLTVTQERQVAEILDAKAVPAVVSPGDNIYIRVRLLPHRGQEIYRDVVFQVPKDQPLGEMNLEVRGGGVVPLPYLIQKQQLNLTDEILARLRKYKNFEDLRSKLEDEDRNYQIVVEILEDGVSMIPDEEKSSSKVKIRNKDKESIPGYLHKGEKAELGVDKDEEKEHKSRVDTEYVIRGDGQFVFQVVSPAEKEKMLRRSAKKKDTVLAKMTKSESEKEEVVAEKSKEDAAESTKAQEVQLLQKIAKHYSV